MQQHVVLGQTVSMPVEVRRASAATAMFPVDADAAQRLIDHSGLEVLRYRPARTLIALVCVRYVDGDLGPYDEFGVCVLVRNHELPGRPTALRRLRELVTGDAGVLIHRLPVDGEYTKAAGREIWGFPKTLADFDTHLEGPDKRMVLREGGRLVVDLRVRRGLPVRAPGAGMALRAYAHLDGVTRCTDWAMAPQGVRTRPGGADLALGDHPLATELAGLGLPRRALFSTSVANLAMSFGDARTV